MKARESCPSSLVRNQPSTSRLGVVRHKITNGALSSSAQKTRPTKDEHGSTKNSRKEEETKETNLFGPESFRPRDGVAGGNGLPVPRGLKPYANAGASFLDSSWTMTWKLGAREDGFLHRKGIERWGSEVTHDQGKCGQQYIYGFSSHRESRRLPQSPSCSLTSKFASDVM